MIKITCLPELAEFEECSRFLERVLRDRCIRTEFLAPGLRIFNFLKAWPTENEIASNLSI